MEGREGCRGGEMKKKPTESEVRDSIQYTARRFADATNQDPEKLRKVLERDYTTVEKKTQERERRGRM